MPNNELQEWWRNITRKEFCIEFDLTRYQGDQIQKGLEHIMPLIIAEAERRKVKEIRERVEKMRPFPFRPCPSCGGKLTLGSSREMRFGCYNKECERVKANNYFYIDMYDSLPTREGENMLIDRILDCLKDE